MKVIPRDRTIFGFIDKATKRMENRIDKGANKNCNPLIALQGSPGCGKSFCLTQIANINSFSPQQLKQIVDERISQLEESERQRKRQESSSSSSSSSSSLLSSYSSSSPSSSSSSSSSCRLSAQRKGLDIPSKAIIMKHLDKLTSSFGITITFNSGMNVFDEEKGYADEFFAWRLLLSFVFTSYLLFSFFFFLCDNLTDSLIQFNSIIQSISELFLQTVSCWRTTSLGEWWQSSEKSSK